MDIKEKETKIQVRFPHDVWSEVKRLAENHERSFNGEVVWALREYIHSVNEKERVIHGTRKKVQQSKAVK